MKKSLRWLWIPLAASGLLLGLVVGINAFDEPLNAQAAALSEPRAPAVSASQNGYLAVIGMGAADGADATAYAKAWLAEARMAAQENRPEKPIEAKRAERPALCDASQM